MSKVKGAKKPAPKPQPPAQLKRGSMAALGNPSFKRASQVMSKSIMESRARLHNASRAPRRKDDEGFRDGDYYEDGEDWGGAKELVKPEDQLEIDEKGLKEEFTRVLTADNPHAPANIVRYNFKDKHFKQVPAIEQLAIHFSMDSNLLHKDSDEAQRQLNKDTSDQSDDSEEEGDQEGEERPASSSKSAGEGKQLRNQFNFSDRASQTLNNPYRDRSTATEPPPRADFSANANQMTIFDSYFEDLTAQEKAKEKKGKGGDDNKKEVKAPVNEIQSDDITRVRLSSKIMERMVNQNTFDEIAQDFKYYDDPGDLYREGAGSMLPLWRFKYDKTRKMTITAIIWSQVYDDLFAVGQGSYDFTDQSSGGLICFHSLKNPTHPEYVFPTVSGVMCLDIHPEHGNLLAAGLYDGTVLVYDLNENSVEPVYKATANTGKHTDPVWQVSWQRNDMDGNINFYSVSGDGRVVTWKLVKNELQFQDALTLKTPNNQQRITIGSGTAIGFSPFLDHLFLVGSEEGDIYKCSKAYTSHYLDVYKAHHMAVHCITWNPYHQNVFASCGADWTVKIWDHTRPDPMFTFDLNNIVGDIAWAPYCSTVLAAVTSDGKVHIFDLNINKYEPLCVQSVIQKKRTKLTHVCFNPEHPILIVGDDKGTVISLKISPNLRKNLTEKNRTKETEVARMEKLISFVREPLLEKQN